MSVLLCRISTNFVLSGCSDSLLRKYVQSLWNSVFAVAKSSFKLEEELESAVSSAKRYDSRFECRGRSFM